MYHEATLINLFEVIFFANQAVEASGDNLLELVDFCARHTIRLASDAVIRDSRGHRPRVSTSGASDASREASKYGSKEAAAARLARLEPLPVPEELTRQRSEVCSANRVIAPHSSIALQ